MESKQMLALRRVLCWVGVHAPLRRRAHWDGLNFVSTCKACSVRLRRHEGGRWARDWMEEQERRPEAAGTGAD